jgi:hypothetical protein
MTVAGCSHYLRPRMWEDVGTIQCHHFSDIF